MLSLTNANPLTILQLLLAGGEVTLEVSIGSWLVSVIAGLLFLAFRQAPYRPVRWAADFVITCLRSMPQLVLLYLVFFGLGGIGININPIVSAIVALGLTEAGFTSEVYRAGLLTVSDEQREAGASLGLGSFQIFRLIVLPEMVPFLVPPLLNSFVGLTKAATIASAVGVPEILYQSTTIINETFQVLLVSMLVIVLYVIFTVPLTRLSAALELRLGYAH